jgi:tetratricopeptide (TPR) repeat protein
VERAAIAERRSYYVELFSQLLRHKPATLPSPAQERRRALAALDPLIAHEHGPADALEIRGAIEEGLWRELHADSLLGRAIADYRAATERDPHRARAWGALGTAYLNAGQFTDALWAIQHAFDEDVFEVDRVPLLRAQFDVALRAGDYDLAERACRAGATNWPTDERFNDCELELWAHTRGDLRSAAAALAKIDSLTPHEVNPVVHPLRELWAADILARAGLGDSADRVAQRALRNAPAEWQALLLGEEAYLRLQRGDPDSALALIGAVVRLDPTVRNVTGAVPWFAPLHTDPRFTAALALAPSSR